MPKIDDQPEDPFEKLVLDEDFVRAAEHKEQSGRARMLAARWKHTAPQDTAWRPPVAATRRRRLRGLLRGRWQAPLFVVVAVGLVLASMNAKALHDWAFSKAPGSADAGGAGGAGGAGVLPPETVTPSAAPPTDPLADTATQAHPFAGSPADKWPSGAGAITVPTAHAVGVYSASTVASYLQHAKDFLVDSNLLPVVVRGGYPSAALDLVDPHETMQGNIGIIDYLHRELAHSDASHNATELFSRFNPDQAIPINDVVKVQGELSFTSDGSGGLAIHADVTFVYGLKPGPHPAPWADASASPSATGAGTGAQVGYLGAVRGYDDLNAARSIVRRIIDFQVPDGQKWQHTPGKLLLTHWLPDIGNSACGFDNGFINPEFPGSADSVAPSGPASDPYDRSRLPDPNRKACGLLSRT